MVAVLTSLDSTTQHVDTETGKPTKDFTNFLKRLTDMANAAGGGVIGQNQQNANYTLVLADAAKFLYHTSASGHTWTIPANSSAPYPIGTAISFVNDGSGAVTIAITSDTMVMVGTGFTGSRNLGQYGLATALKVTATRWFISGVGLS